VEGMLIKRSACLILHSPQRQPRDKGCLLCRILLHAPVDIPWWMEPSDLSHHCPREEAMGQPLLLGASIFMGFHVGTLITCSLA